MGRTKLTHSIPLVAFLMTLMIIGQPVIEFLFVAIATTIVAAALLYTVLGFFYVIDRIFDYFCRVR
jgi:hypothetical protein